MPGASRSVIINAAMERVFSVITDYEKYSQFLPEVKRISISDREGNKVQVHYELELIKTIRYTLQLEEEPPRRVSWSLVKRGVDAAKPGRLDFGARRSDPHSGHLQHPGGARPVGAPFSGQRAGRYVLAANARGLQKAS